MRRMFRRNIRKTPSQNIPPILQEANFAFDKGEYGRAAELFENIAQTADARGRHVPRSFIYRQDVAESWRVKSSSECHPSNADLSSSPSAVNGRDCIRREK